MTERVMRGSGARLRVTFDIDGEPSNADAAVTVTVMLADGTAVATDAATTRAAPGTYEWTASPRAALNVLTLTWSGTFGGLAQAAVTQAEIVGGFYFSVSEARATDPTFAALDADLVERVRAEVEDEVESRCGVAFVPRFARERIVGPYGRTLILGHMRPRVLLSARVYADATASTLYGSTELADVELLDHGEARRITGVWNGRAALIEYEHGHDAPPPQVKRASLLLFRQRAMAEHGRLLGQTVTVDAEGNATSVAIEANKDQAEIDSLLKPWAGSRVRVA